MKIEITRDVFDSEMLSKECYKICISDIHKLFNLEQLDNAISETVSAGMVIAITEHNPHIINKLFKGGFRFISAKNIYLKKEISTLLMSEKSDFEVFSKKDIVGTFKLKDFSNLISSLVIKSRYWKDELIPLKTAWKVYETWFDNSIYGSYADEIFVIKNLAQIIGFVSLKKDDDIGYIDLIVVDHSAKGTGTGKILLNASALYFINHSINKICVETESENIEANRFYQKNSFLIEAHKLVFHKHHNMLD